MRLHGNARLSPKGRLLLCRRVLEDEDWSLAAAAEAAGVSERTARKWVARYERDGEAGLADRSSAPRTVANKTPEQTIEAIAALRRLRFTGAQIAELLGMALSTVSGILKAIGLGKLWRLEPAEPPNRYERRHPGELIHVDIKRLGRIGWRGAGHRATGSRGRGQRSRGAGWQFVHIAIDDHSRLAYAEVLGDEKATTAVAFLHRALGFFAAHGVTVHEVMSDNGAAYVSLAHRLACRALGVRHLRTRPYRPRTNGKAERFIRTMLAEWAYGALYGSETERTAALSGWLERYNFRRPHSALGHKPPSSRITGHRNNLLGSYR
jgi:transposase InsO family protein